MLTALVLPLFTVFVATGLRGVDFGYHWDEAGWHIDPARRMVQTGIFLPKPYIYPSFDKWLVVWPSLPHGIRAAIDNDGQPLPIRTKRQLIDRIGIPVQLITIAGSLSSGILLASQQFNPGRYHPPGGCSGARLSNFTR